MSKRTKKWLIAAASLVTIGVIMFAAVMTAYHWDFSRLNTDHFETNTYEIKENFSDIKMNTETADILFAASSDDKCRVVCYEQENMKHSVVVQDGTLTVSVADDREWFEHIGFNFHSPKITVYLPKTEYVSLVIKESTGNIEIPNDFRFVNVDIHMSTGDVNLFASASESVKINTTTGDIMVNEISAGRLDLSVSTGEITVSDVICQGDIRISAGTDGVKLENVTCQNLISTGSTGNVSLKNVIGTGKFSIVRSTGDVIFDRSDAAEIFVKTSTGDVSGSLLTEKIFITESSTGDVNVPKTTTGGKCEIVVSTGDINIEIY